MRDFVHVTVLAWILFCVSCILALFYATQETVLLNISWLHWKYHSLETLSYTLLRDLKNLYFSAAVAKVVAAILSSTIIEPHAI